MVRPLPLSVKSIPGRGVDVMTDTVNVNVNASRDSPAKMSSERFTVFVALDTPPCCIMKSLEREQTETGHVLDDSKSNSHSFRWSWEMFSFLVHTKS